tara:strand:+ start:4820 stop:5938 length:1119 start_codon:yes stop_codon:yes gene_type:complete
MRPIITKLLAVLVLAGGFFLMKTLIASKKKNKPASTVSVPTAYVSTAQNKIVPINVIENGRLSAKYKIDLFAEVQGVMQTTSTEFKPGARYTKGAILVKIKSDDFHANLQAQKSVLQNLITGILPDLKLDYPEAYNRWDAYLNAFDMNKSIAPLPEPATDKEKFFLTGRNIYTTYYNTKNLEIVMQKYTLTAPFNGVLTEALVTPGSLVRNGQKLGEFINPTEYELELAVSKTLINAIKIGEEVNVTNPDNTSESWVGKVSRINGKINSATQTIQIFVHLNGEGLREGMYLEANISGKDEMNALEIPRNLLMDDTEIYVVGTDSVLTLAQVNVMHKSRSNVVIQGVENGTWVLAKPIPGAYAGMKVNVKIED